MGESVDREMLDKLCEIAVRAGEAIMEIYEHDDFDVRSKADDSPLTKADLAANDVIVESLRELTPDIPVLSEESRKIPYAERKDWLAFWLVDPLDGTKEFIKRNGEFTVNIALIEVGAPTLGVVHAPALERTYFAMRDEGAFRRDPDGEKQITVRDAVGEPVVVVVSRSHLHEADEEFIAELEDKYGAVDTTPTGSSLKLCLVAEGSADVYPRFGPTMEWDIGAAHAVLVAAGGRLEQIDGSAFVYNKEELVNPFFIARSDVLQPR